MLHYGAEKGHLDVCKLLLKAGASKDAREEVCEGSISVLHSFLVPPSPLSAKEHQLFLSGIYQSYLVSAKPFEKESDFQNFIHPYGNL